MTPLLVFAFLFLIGSLLGWGIEVVFRCFFSANNPERKWINPGFCMGPYLPLFGVGLCVLAAMAIVGASIILSENRRTNHMKKDSSPPLSTAEPKTPLTGAEF